MVQSWCTHLFACQLTKTTAIGIKPICGRVVAPCGHLIQQWFRWSIPFITLPKQNFGLVQRSNGLRPIARQIKFYTGVKCLTPSFFYSLLMQRRKNTTQWAPIQKSYTNDHHHPCTRTFCIFLKCGCTPHSTNFCIPLPLISGTKNCAISVKKVATKKEQRNISVGFHFQSISKLNIQPPHPLTIIKHIDRPNFHGYFRTNHTNAINHAAVRFRIGRQFIVKPFAH